MVFIVKHIKYNCSSISLFPFLNHPPSIVSVLWNPNSCVINNSIFQSIEKMPVNVRINYKSKDHHCSTNVE